MKISDLKDLSFSDPYMHGESYLFDENYKKEIVVRGKVRVDDDWNWVTYKSLEEFYCIMCVYPPELTESGKWEARYNSDRALWASEKTEFDSGPIPFETREELEELIEKSKAA